MITTKCIIRFDTHACYITVDDDDIITVFKQDARGCDFEVFINDQFAASEYILEELPKYNYRVVIEGEED
jgi:hypothetical protein